MKSRPKKTALAAFAVGFLFAIGLGLSGMTQPKRVIAFLDIGGTWDPALLFVMVGAIGVHFVSYRLIRQRPAPWFSDSWQVPSKKQITPALLLGSALFGMGWGLAGYCPGPAVTALASLSWGPVVFVVGMVAGMGLFTLADKKFKFKK